MFDPELMFIFRFGVPAVCGVAVAAMDLQHRKIYNSVSVPLFVAGVIARTVMGGWGWEGLGDSLLGGASGFAPLFLLFLIGGGGGGDVKFMTAIGAWLGPKHMLWVFVLSSALLVLFSLGNIVYRLFTGRLRPGLKTTPGKISADKKRPRGTVPYAVPVTIAVWIRFVWMLFLGHTT